MRKSGIGTWVGFLLIMVWCLLPVAWIVSLSFKSLAETTTGSAQFLPKHPTFDNYKVLLGMTSDKSSSHDFLASLRNSFGISIIATVLAVLIATLAAYAIARLDFKGKRLVLSMALAIAMFPVVALVGPLFDMWRTFHLFNTWPGLIIPYMTFTLPLAAPGVFTAAILTFFFAWNEFVLALSLTSTTGSRTVPAQMAFFVGPDPFNPPYSQLATASVIVTVPVIIIVLLFQRKIVAGLTSGAVKG
jgi:multiple sugar transport system permease protein